MLPVDERYLVDTLAALVSINSINPAFSSGATDERLVAGFVESRLTDLGMRTRRFEPEPGRVSVVGTLPGRGGGRSLLLYAHHDTVGVEGMPDPLSPRIEDGRMYGRGAYDMKCGLAACLAAVKALNDARVGLAGEVMVAAVADEEVASIGMVDILRHIHADAAIVTEPTELRLCLAHKGFSWIEVVTRGRAAHGSRFDEGIDANMRMGRFLARLELLERDLRHRPQHALVGPPSLHAAVIRGGSGTSTYAANCRLEIERRTIPGETEHQVMHEIEAIVEALEREDSTFHATVRSLLARDSFEISPAAPIAQVVERVAESVLEAAPAHIGASYWMDAAFLASAGIETVVIGAAGGGAHADEEWVELSSVTKLAQILAHAAREFCA